MMGTLIINNIDGLFNASVTDIGTSVYQHTNREDSCCCLYDKYSHHGGDMNCSFNINKKSTEQTFTFILSYAQDELL